MSSVVVTPLDTSEKKSLSRPQSPAVRLVYGCPPRMRGFPDAFVPWVSTRALERMRTTKKKRKTDQIHKNRRINGGKPRAGAAGLDNIQQTTLELRWLKVTVLCVIRQRPAISERCRLVVVTTCGRVTIPSKISIRD